MTDILGAILLVAGSVFLLLGGLGLLRMPDVFNRIQAGTKTTTLGTILILLGSAFLYPEWSLKLLLIGLFLLFTNPISSQVLSRAAHRGQYNKSARLCCDALEHDLVEKKAQTVTEDLTAQEDSAVHSQTHAQTHAQKVSS